MKLTVYLSGEIHTDWRDEVALACAKQSLDVMFLGPCLASRPRRHVR